MALSEKARADARVRAENDLYFLATEILEWPFLTERAHRPVCDWIVSADPPPGRDFKQTRMLLWPRYHGKTTLFTIADNIRLHLKYPGISIAVGHESMKLAVPMLLDIRTQFEQKEKLKWIGAHDVCYRNPAKESPVWNQDQFTLKRRAFNRTPSFVAVSPDAMPVSMHFDVWSWDDLVTAEGVRQLSQRDKAEQAYFLSQPFLPPSSGRAVRLQYVKIAGTRYHLDDAYRRLMDRGIVPESKRFIASMIAPDGEFWMNHAFCEQRTGPEDRRETLDELRIRCGGPHIFDACMMQSPVPEGTAAFKTDEVRRFDLMIDDERGFLGPLEGRRYRYYTAIDLNCQSTNTGDFAVVMTCAKDDRGNVYVVDITRGHPTRTQHVEWIMRHAATWKPEAIYVETTGYQKTFLQDLDRAKAGTPQYLPVVQLARGGYRALSKNDRIMGLQGMIEQRRLWVPNGLRFQPLMQELEEFVPDRDSRHDDCLDCLADIVRYGRSGNVPEKEAEPEADDAVLSRWVADNDESWQTEAECTAPSGVNCNA